MADIDIVIDEEGYNYDFTIFDGAGALDISGFDTKTLDIRPADFTGTLLLDSKALSFVTDGKDGKARWPVDKDDFGSQPAGVAYAQITLIDTTLNITRKTALMTIMIHRSIA